MDLCDYGLYIIKSVPNVWLLISQQQNELERFSLFLFKSSFSTLCRRINYTVQVRGRKGPNASVHPMWETRQVGDI